MNERVHKSSPFWTNDSSYHCPSQIYSLMTAMITAPTQYFSIDLSDRGMIFSKGCKIMGKVFLLSMAFRSALAMAAIGMLCLTALYVPQQPKYERR